MIFNVDFFHPLPIYRHSPRNLNAFLSPLTPFFLSIASSSIIIVACFRRSGFNALLSRVLCGRSGKPFSFLPLLLQTTSSFSVFHRRELFQKWEVVWQK